MTRKEIQTDVFFALISSSNGFNISKIVCSFFMYSLLTKLPTLVPIAIRDIELYLQHSRMWY